MQTVPIFVKNGAGLMKVTNGTGAVVYMCQRMDGLD